MDGIHTYTHTHSHTHTCMHALTQSQAESLHISSHSLHSAAKRLKCHKCSCSRRGQWQLSKLLLLPSLLPAPYHCHSLHISLTLLTLSFLLPLLSSSLSLFFSFFLFCSLSYPLPCSLICLFPLSSVCTMHINYSEAVSRFLRLIQSECGSALMGSCCTCYRLQPTLETAGGGREGGRERNRQREQRRQARMRGRDKDNEPTQTNRSGDREGKIF